MQVQNKMKVKKMQHLPRDLSEIVQELKGHIHMTPNINSHLAHWDVLEFVLYSMNMECLESNMKNQIFFGIE
jgi:hypothetical protein